jgi:hypothetical protein
MIIPASVPSELVGPISHAIERQDTHLLNLIELEVIRAIGVQPDCACEGEKWHAKGIASMGRGLIISWSQKSGRDCDCRECEGMGTLEAYGRTTTVSVDCPACDGMGTVDDDGEYDGAAFTDIDGNEITEEIPEGVEFIDRCWPLDALSVLLIKQSKVAS